MKPLLTARVTVLEAFRGWMCANEEDEPWRTEENFLQSLKGILIPNAKMNFGSAGHLIIEKPHANKTDTGYLIDGHALTLEQVKPLLQYVSEHPLMKREIPIAKRYSTRFFDLIVTGTVDCLEGCQLRDNKFIFSSKDMSDYLDSLQWRFYLDMLNLNVFFYDFHRVHGFEKLEDCAKARIAETESMMVCAYEGMQGDIQGWLESFAEYVTAKQLTNYLIIDTEKALKIRRGGIKI